MTSRAPLPVAGACRAARSVAVYCAKHSPRLLPRAAALVRDLLAVRDRERIRQRSAQQSLGKQEQALAVLFAHPEWTDKQVAAEIHTPRTYLYKMPKYVEARRALKSGRRDYQNADVSTDPDTD